MKKLKYKRRKICVITSSRADYGQLKPLIKLINKDKKLILKLVVSGSHLVKNLGFTQKEIKKDKIKISSRVNLNIKGFSEKQICNYTGEAIKKFSKCFSNLNPDIILVLGDRYEIFSAVTSALILNIPVAHLHGGEITLGVIDDAFRHSITKMSDIHFTVNRNFRNRVINMGENPKNVYEVGSLSAENIKSAKFLSKNEIENKFKFKFLKNNFVVTIHPERVYSRTIELTKNLLGELKKLKNTLIIFTSPNHDAHGGIIKNHIKKYIKTNKNGIFVESFGYQNYISCLKISDGVIGNSSSGLNEAPYLKIGSINIGIRQKGRPLEKSVISAGIKKNQIGKAIKKLLTLKKNKKKYSKFNYYRPSNAKLKILKILKSKKIKDIKTKIFFN